LRRHPLNIQTLSAGACQALRLLHFIAIARCGNGDMLGVGCMKLPLGAVKIAEEYLKIATYVPHAQSI
jgi:hypothetical protein